MINEKKFKGKAIYSPSGNGIITLHGYKAFKISGRGYVYEHRLVIENHIGRIFRTMYCCDLYKIGLESGMKYDKKRLIDFISAVTRINRREPHPNGKFIKIYFKDCILEQAGISRENLPVNCVGRDYNMFNT